MQPLTGNDLFQLYMESATQPMHTLKVLILDPPETDAPETDGLSPTTMTGLRDWAERAVSAIPPLHWRVVSAPLRLGASAWVEQHQLDLDAHLRCTRVAKPGERDQLADVLNVLMEGKLDRDRPLWELWLVEGLANGRVAHVWKMHHAIADGGASARILDQLYQHTPDSRAEARPRVSPPPATPPFALARVALARRGRMTRSLPILIRRSRAAKKVSSHRRRLGLPTGAKALSGPMTRYNRGLTTHRTVAWESLKMADIQLGRAAFDCTVNDVYLTAAAGALRRHLERVGELATGPLTASVPVGLRQPSQADQYANRMGVWYLSLATNVADPVERLHATRMITKGAREAAEVGGGPELLAEWQAYASIFKPMNRLGTLGSRRTHRPLFNLTVSNVRGPSKTLYADGVPVIDLFSLSVLSAGQGLNLTGWSYRDWFVVGIVACPEDEPDIWALAGELPGALEELRQAALDRLKRISEYVGPAGISQ
ncbi:MAG: wax ester/triacylglycerol synthase family O-acyltransferase [Mycobacterium sp.]|nr:wax ester/triacylglycerol synthase family O-acyltransferase [Mycobacterium sp.]